MMYDNSQLSPVESLAERPRSVEARRADVVDIAAYRVAAVRPVQGEADDMAQDSSTHRQVRAYTSASEAMKAAAVTAGPVTGAEQPMSEENPLLEEARKAASQAYDSAA